MGYTCGRSSTSAHVVLFLMVMLAVKSWSQNSQSSNANGNLQSGTESNKPSARSAEQLPNAPEPVNDSSAATAKRISPTGKLPYILAPQMTRSPLSSRDKTVLYRHDALNPVGLAFPALGAGFSMINPPSHYPHEWKAGGEGFGRLYGDRIAVREADKAARFLSEITFHEDPRYLPSDHGSVFVRTYHALSFVLIDRSDSGHKMPAVSNFAGASASGFVGMAYLPDGFADMTHAGQRTASKFIGFAAGNIANEFCPEWSPLIMRLHVPFIHPPCSQRMHSHASAPTPSSADQQP